MRSRCRRLLGVAALALGGALTGFSAPHTGNFVSTYEVAGRECIVDLHRHDANAKGTDAAEEMAAARDYTFIGEFTGIRPEWVAAGSYCI